MLKQIQAATGLVFAAFVALHIANTWLASIGPGAYDQTQAVLRVFYQFPPVEALLLAALAVHMVAGVVRMVTEPKRALSVRGRWHRYAGIFLLVFIAGHILAVRGPSWFYDIYPGFAGLAFSIDYVPLYFYPYYFLLAMAGFYHGLNGVSIALPRLGVVARLPNRQLINATVLATVLTVTALLGLGGVWFEVDHADSAFGQLALSIADELFP